MLNFTAVPTVVESPLSDFTNVTIGSGGAMQSQAVSMSTITIDQLANIVNSGDRDNLQNFLAGLEESVESFCKRVKKPGEKPEGNLLDSVREPEGVEAFVQSELGFKMVSAVIKKTVEFLDETKKITQPGHCKRHNGYLDPLVAVDVIQNTPLHTYQKLAVLFGSIAHDIGRVVELSWSGKTVGGEIADMHSKYSFLIVQAALNQVVSELGNDDESRKAFMSFGDLVLNAVLVHTKGGSKECPVAQLVSTIDRMFLVGNEAIVRMLGYDVGVLGLPITPVLDEEFRYRLPMPSESADIIGHVQFYARHLFAAYGEYAQKMTDRLKQESICFLAEATLGTKNRTEILTEMRKNPEDMNPLFLQTFFPEIIEFRRNQVPPLLPPEAWTDGYKTRNLEEGGFPKAKFDQNLFLDAFECKLSIQQILNSKSALPFATRPVDAQPNPGVATKVLGYKDGTCQDVIAHRIKEAETSSDGSKTVEAIESALNEVVHKSEPELLENLKTICKNTDPDHPVAIVMRRLLQEHPAYKPEVN